MKNLPSCQYILCDCEFNINYLLALKWQETALYYKYWFSPLMPSSLRKHSRSVASVFLSRCLLTFKTKECVRFCLKVNHLWKDVYPVPLVACLTVSTTLLSGNEKRMSNLWCHTNELRSRDLIGIDRNNYSSHKLEHTKISPSLQIKILFL